MAVVTWAPKSDLNSRTMHIRQCESCAREFFQVPEDWQCPNCKGVTWPIGLLAVMRLVADRYGAPCLDLSSETQGENREINAETPIPTDHT